MVCVEEERFVFFVLVENVFEVVVVEEEVMVYLVMWFMVGYLFEMFEDGIIDDGGVLFFI